MIGFAPIGASMRLSVVALLACCHFGSIPAFGFSNQYLINRPDDNHLWRRLNRPRIFQFRQRSFVSLPLQLSSESLSNCRPTVGDRLNLDHKFGRWRYLQNLLEGDAINEDTNTILFIVLDGFLRFPHPADSDGSEATGSPELNDARREILEELISKGSDGKILNALDVSEGDKEPIADISILNQLEKLLPDPFEDEDAHKGLWDTIIEIHGREAVKIDERNNLPDWKARCLIARVLLHYDFLTYGLVAAPMN